jgi:hypothetical protein
MEFKGLLSLVAPLNMSPYNKVLVIRIHLLLGHFGFLATFFDGDLEGILIWKHKPQ